MAIESLALNRISGVMILSAIILALIAANSPLAGMYAVFHHTPIRVGLGLYKIDAPLIVWINQGLMTFFFVLVGVEIKHELVGGHLSTLRKAALPAIAALGGMIVPALIYVAFAASDGEALRGWAIPMATDIALALALLSLLGNRVPVGLKAFLMALAIFDDLGAVAIIAFFYGEEVHTLPLMLAVLTFAAMVGLNRVGQAKPLPLAMLGAILWLALFQSGIEAALAGVLIAAVVPNGAKHDDSHSPLLRTQRLLHPWASLLIVPIFGFFNAGVTIEIETLQNVTGGVSLGVFFGLFLGKQIGVLGATWCAVKLNIGVLPPAVGFKHIYCAGLLAGVGFTMGLFVTALAFDTDVLAASARLAILIGSTLSALVGLAVLWSAQSDPEKQISLPQSDAI
ncbi:Na+/H+ antiporter NhaA [Sulfitobacter sp. M13]